MSRRNEPNREWSDNRGSKGPPRNQQGPSNRNYQGSEEKVWKKKDLKKERAQQQQQPLQPSQPSQAHQSGAWGGQPQGQPQERPPSQQSWGSQPQRPPQQQQGQQFPGLPQQRQQPPQQQSWGNQPQPYRGPPQKQQAYGGQQHGSQSAGRPQYQQQSYQQGNPRFAKSGGGSVAEGSTFQVEANYVDLNIPTDLKEAYHYDVKIDPDRPKKFYRKAVQLYCQQQFQNISVAYDGKASAYSAEKLPKNKLVGVSVTVVPEMGKPKEFKVTLSETKDMVIDMTVLRTYGTTTSGLADKPMRALQCLEVVLTQQCHEKGVKSGRSFFYRPDRPEDLMDCYELWYGLFQAAILGERLLLNIDVAHKAFPKPKTVLDLYKDLVHNNRTNKLEEFLAGTEIIYTPPKCFNQTGSMYKVNRLERVNSRTHRFPLEDGKETTVYDYYKSKGCTIQYPDYPLLFVGNPKAERKTLLPIEFCRMAENQVSNKQAGPRQVSEIIKHSAISSWKRKEKILALFKYFHAASSPVIEKFGLTFGKEFVKVAATRLFAPKLEYSNQKTIVPINGVWRPMNVPFYKSAGAPSKPLKWCIISLEDSRNLRELAIRNLGSQLMRASNSCGVAIEQKSDGNIKIIFTDPRRLSDTLGQCVSVYDFVIVILPKFNNSSSYSDVKKIAELEKGILTQCIKADTVERRINDSTLGNILLKLNMKLNGINQIIDKVSQTTIYGKGNDVMLVGADVTHPSPQQRFIPSLVGTCATSDPDCVKYNMQFRIQDPKKEIIVGMKDIMLEHLKVYYDDQKKYPTHILYYRDGVADGQFEQVLNDELKKGMNFAFGEISKRTNTKYNPKVTCIIVQKRNHTRFFPMNEQQACGNYHNVFPGTCVTDVICHPKEKEFFLVSHESIKGTARPSKYIVIRDDASFNLEDIKNLTYHLCHLFPRCNRSVSYPAPAYLAHLVAARAKVYIENERINMRELDVTEKRKKIVPRFRLGNPMFFI